MLLMSFLMQRAGTLVCPVIMPKFIAGLLFVLIIFTSCTRYIPLIVSNPEVPQGNIVTEKNQITGSVNLTGSLGIYGEQSKKSFNLAADSKFSISNRIFVEGSYLNQSESIKLNRQVFPIFNGMVDTVSKSNIYNNNAFTIGGGYYKELGKNSDYYFSVAGGYLQHQFSVDQKSKINSNAETTGNIDFAQRGIYINPAVQYVTKNIAVVLGFKQSFYKFRNVEYSGSTESRDSLSAVISKIQTPTQLFVNCMIAPFEIPLAFRVGLGINAHSLTENLENRVFAGVVGVAYYPFERGKK